ncbi:MAG TPA: YigZ family protein [Atribacterota bacterium]|nr:YigZ family protein [Atribacterota bacterium]
MDVISYHQTINNSIQIKNTINKSRFIASVQEIKDECEARIFLKSIAEQFPDATHHCWAYQFGVGEQTVSQYSDGGEPANSAGPPILQAIKRKKITNVMIVISRYFGGIKLGISGLIRAYRDTALKALQAAGKVKKFPLRKYIIEDVEYQTLGSILQSIESQAGRIDDIQYGEKVKIKVYLPDNLQEWITQVVKNSTKGEARIRFGEIHWYRVK